MEFPWKFHGNSTRFEGATFLENPEGDTICHPRRSGGYACIEITSPRVTHFRNGVSPSGFSRKVAPSNPVEIPWKFHGNSTFISRQLFCNSDAKTKNAHGHVLFSKTLPCNWQTSGMEVVCHLGERALEMPSSHATHVRLTCDCHISNTLPCNWKTTSMSLHATITPTITPTITSVHIYATRGSPGAINPCPLVAWLGKPLRKSATCESSVSPQRGCCSAA